jgi:hypothetical protein
MARRILNRKDLRADYEAAERRKQDEDEVEGDEEEAEDDDDEVEATDEEAEADEEGEEEAPVKKKRKVAAPKEPKPKRARTPKQVRQRVVWVVLDNSSRPVQTFDYNKERDARELAARLQAEKKSTYFVQPKKEPMEEKKE